MVVVGEVTFGEPVRHAFGGGCGGVPITFLRGGCVCVVLLGLGQRQRPCIGCGVGYSAVREDVEALGGELEDDVPLRRLLWGPLVGPVLRSVEGDLVAPSPIVVGEEAEDGVLLRVLHAFHVCRHVGDVDGVLGLPFLCGGAWREGGRWCTRGVPAP